MLTQPKCALVTDSEGWVDCYNSSYNNWLQTLVRSTENTIISDVDPAQMRACHGVITIDYRLTTDSLSRQYSVENHHLFVAIEDQISPSRPILILILRDARALSKWKPPVYPSRTLSNLKGRRNEYSPESNSSRLRTHGNLFQCIQVDVTYGDRTWTAPKMLNDQWSMIDDHWSTSINGQRSTVKGHCHRTHGFETNWPFRGLMREVCRRHANICIAARNQSSPEDAGMHR